ANPNEISHKTKNAAYRRVLEINIGELPLAVWIEPKLGAAAFGIGFGFTPALLIRCLKRAQASHFIEDAFRVELAFQPLERAIHWFAFSNNDFWHHLTSIP